MLDKDEEDIGEAAFKVRNTDKSITLSAPGASLTLPASVLSGRSAIDASSFL